MTETAKAMIARLDALAAKNETAFLAALAAFRAQAAAAWNRRKEDA